MTSIRSYFVCKICDTKLPQPADDLCPYGKLGAFDEHEARRTGWMQNADDEWLCLLEPYRETRTAAEMEHEDMRILVLNRYLMTKGTLLANFERAHAEVHQEGLEAWIPWRCPCCAALVLYRRWPGKVEIFVATQPTAAVPARPVTQLDARPQGMLGTFSFDRLEDLDPRQRPAMQLFLERYGNAPLLIDAFQFWIEHDLGPILAKELEAAIGN